MGFQGIGNEDIKVGIIDDQKLFRIGLQNLLEQRDGIQITLSEKNGLDLLKNLQSSAKEKLPNVLLLDIEMPEMDGFEACNRISTYFPNIMILMLSMHDSDAYVQKAVQSGAHGYLIKDEEPDEIVQAIKEVHERGYYFNDQLSVSTLKRLLQNNNSRVNFKNNLLSPREIEIVRFICKELTDKEIGEELGISNRTVETYRKSIMTKIGARKSVGIALFALKNHYIIP